MIFCGKNLPNLGEGGLYIGLLFSMFHQWIIKLSIQCLRNLQMLH